MKMLEMVSSTIVLMRRLSPFCRSFPWCGSARTGGANPDAVSLICGYNFLSATCHREIFLPSQNPIPVAVVGVGVFGRNHARVYKELEQQGEPVRLLGVVDPDINRADAVASEFGGKGFGSVVQMLTTHSELQAASVAAPTVHHLPVARELMK